MVPIDQAQAVAHSSGKRVDIDAVLEQREGRVSVPQVAHFTIQIWEVNAHDASIRISTSSPSLPASSDTNARTVMASVAV